ncbi:hypothetical protein [Paenibacillus sp. UASWS1643]|uniref:hypothetical protein n=1 Tax=Paenibacillus sp. UASWS1643 TaxID=2580422 RepID=UPI0012387851|nr:hypothetical protein [Paenibacillus sp. UASWS1643]KAA8747126.1 hypothetical protein FE296_23350 [Paenibacillus sp. UASWS1643]
MTANNELKTWELAVWVAELERATTDLEHAEKFDDRGSMAHNKEQIRWAKIKIAEIEDFLDIQKGA